MAEVFYTIEGFLTKYKTKNDDKPSHTKIGDKKCGLSGGSYCIPDDKMNDFYKLYKKSVFDKYGLFDAKSIKTLPVFFGSCFLILFKEYSVSCLGCRRIHQQISSEDLSIHSATKF